MTAADDPTATPGAAPADDEYSATVLGSQWIQRPDPDPTLFETRPDAGPHPLPNPPTRLEPTTPVGGAGPWEPTAPARPGSPHPPNTPGGTHRAYGTHEGRGAYGGGGALPGDATYGDATHGDGTYEDGTYGDIRPDRVEGTLLRFGPGVTAALTHRSHLTLPAVRQNAPRRRRGVRRHALPLLVLIVVVSFLAWQRSATGPGLEKVSVSTRQTTLGCGRTADIVGTLTTDGRPGTVTYRWVRSDGTTSGVLREVLSRGQKRARIHLLWTFEGKGTYEATAALRILTPEARTASVRFTYDCS